MRYIYYVNLLFISIIITCETMVVNLHIKMINQCGYILRKCNYTNIFISQS